MLSRFPLPFRLSLIPVCFIISFNNVAFSAENQVEPPCSAAHGSFKDKIMIEEAMFSGDQEAVLKAVNQAKATRGLSVGCSIQATQRATVDTHPVSLKEIVETWRNIHADALSHYEENEASQCPPLGRASSALALSGYLARYGGYDVNLEPLMAMTNDAVATQYLPTNAAIHAQLTTLPHGVYGLSAHHASRFGTQCKLNRTVKRYIERHCAMTPQYCASYDKGVWEGERFLVADIAERQLDAGRRIYGGGLAIDHSWTGTMIIEAALQTGRSEYVESAFTAGKWSMQQPPVRHHYMTAHNITLLAQLLSLADGSKKGHEAGIELREALIDKLTRNLLPGVLIDLNADGLVDGMHATPFSSLTLTAQRPGRMWDGVNSQIKYQAMNAQAVVEAYVAFRDRGEVEIAKALRQYAIAMLDNIAWEVTHLGPPEKHVSLHPVISSLLTGIWKIAQYENQPHALWVEAVTALWNTGYPHHKDGRTAYNVSLYLLVASQTPYIPLKRRVENLESNHPGIQAFNTVTSQPELIDYAGFAVVDDASIEIVGEYEHAYLGFGIYSNQPLVNNGIRSELHIDYPFEEGDIISYRWKLKLAETFESDAPDNRWWVIGQWHDQPDTRLNETWDDFPSRSPPIAFYYGQIDGEDYLALNYGLERSEVQHDLIPIQRTEWTEIRATIKWSTENNGHIDLYINDSKTPAISFSGRNMHNHFQHFLALGMYRDPEINTENWAYFDDLLISREK